MTIKTVSFNVSSSHPDFEVAADHCYQVRALRNGINSILRTKYFRYRYGDDADFSIAAEYGLTRANVDSISKKDHDSLRKTVSLHQGIDLPAKVAQSATRSLGASWTSFYRLRKKKIKANIPGYSRKYHVAEYNPQAISRKKLKEGWVVPTGWSTGFALPEQYQKVKSARVVPTGTGFELKVLYEAVSDDRQYTPQQGLMAGVDPGLNNLFTIGFSDLREGIIVDGKPLKHINSHYNHLIAELSGKLDKEKSNISKKINKGLKRTDPGYVHVYRPLSRRLDGLWVKRNRKIKHYYTTATNRVVDQLCAAGVETVVIGWNKENKQRINIGRRNNRKFVQVPLAAILDNLAAKCAEAGMVVVRTEESYTSKSSFVDNDPLPKHGDGQPRPKFSGKRVRRGLYKPENGHAFNADLNGALNIIRKHDLHFSYAEAVQNHNVRMNLVGAGTVACLARRMRFAH